MKENETPDESQLTELMKMELRKKAVDAALEWTKIHGRPSGCNSPLPLAEIFYRYMVTGEYFIWDPWRSVKREHEFGEILVPEKKKE